MSHDDLKLRRAEEAYFLEQNQMLLRNLHEQMAHKSEADVLASHRGKCPGCGHGLESVQVREHSALVCNHCDHVAITSQALNHLVSTSKGRQHLQGLHGQGHSKKKLRSA